MLNMLVPSPLCPGISPRGALSLTRSRFHLLQSAGDRSVRRIRDTQFVPIHFHLAYAGRRCSQALLYDAGSGAAYPIEISATLVTSVVSLLLVLSITFGASPPCPTLLLVPLLLLTERLSLLRSGAVFVPYNGYTITKKWGVFLIGFYLVAMVRLAFLSFSFALLADRQTNLDHRRSTSWPRSFGLDASGHLLPVQFQSCSTSYTARVCFFS